MSEKMLMSLYDEVLKIRQLLEMTIKSDLLKELETLLTTNERKMIWALSNGFTDTKMIAKKTGVSIRAVQMTIKDLQDAELVDVERRGFPKRRFDYVPSSWKIRNKGDKD